MNRVARMAGWVLVSLTVSTVAMAQQGGGRGGDGGSGGGDGNGGGDPSIQQVQRADFERARLTRPVEQRRRPNCGAGPCNEGQVPGQGERARPVVDNACAGGDVYVLRSRSGQVLRAYCEPW